MKKILIGYVTDNPGSGINKYIINFIKTIQNEDVEIDILTRNDKNSVNELLKDCGIHEIKHVSRNTKPIKQYFEMKSILKSNIYDISYYNISNAYDCIGVISSKVNSVTKNVAHSHSSYIEGGSELVRLAKKIGNNLFKPVLSVCCNEYLSCSKKAAEWLYSKKIVSSNQYELIYNTVDYSKFKFNSEVRNNIRLKLNVRDKFVIGHVGRFSYQKNHRFIIELFAKVKKLKENSVLVCVGDGKDMDAIKQYANELGVNESIIYTGGVPNPNDYLQAFDVFVLPSFFEGLPISGIEAQFSGVPCLFSDQISSEVIIGKKSELLSINDSDLWANKIVRINERNNELLPEANNFMVEKNKNQFDKVIDVTHVIK